MTNKIQHDNELVSEIRKAIRRELKIITDQRHPLSCLRCNEHNNELLHEIHKLLKTNASAARCRFSDDEASNVLGMLIAKQADRKPALKNLGGWLKDAKKLVIVDPYILHGNTQESTEQERSLCNDPVKDLLKLLKNTKELDIFHFKDPPKKILSDLKKGFSSGHLRTFETSKIHDRVWIKNSNEARVIGTSFGGIGKKLAFMLDLPKEDLDLFLKELQNIRKE